MDFNIDQFSFHVTSKQNAEHILDNGIATDQPKNFPYEKYTLSLSPNDFERIKSSAIYFWNDVFHATRYSQGEYERTHKVPSIIIFETPFRYMFDPVGHALDYTNEKVKNEYPSLFENNNLKEAIQCQINWALREKRDIASAIVNGDRVDEDKLEELKAVRDPWALSIDKNMDLINTDSDTETYQAISPLTSFITFNPIKPSNILCLCRPRYKMTDIRDPHNWMCKCRFPCQSASSHEDAISFGSK